MDPEAAPAGRILVLAAGLLAASGYGGPPDSRELSLAHFLPVDHALTDWLPASGPAFVLLMNPGACEALSSGERGWIDEAADASLSDAGAAAMARADADGLRMAEAAGVQAIRLPESERRRFEQAAASVRATGVARRLGGMTAGEVLRLFGTKP